MHARTPGSRWPAPSAPRTPMMQCGIAEPRLAVGQEPSGTSASHELRPATTVLQCLGVGLAGHQHPLNAGTYSKVQRDPKASTPQGTGASMELLWFDLHHSNVRDGFEPPGLRCYRFRRLFPGTASCALSTLSSSAASSACSSTARRAAAHSLSMASADESASLETSASGKAANAPSPAALTWLWMSRSSSLIAQAEMWSQPMRAAKLCRHRPVAAHLRAAACRPAGAPAGMSESLEDKINRALAQAGTDMHFLSEIEGSILASVRPRLRMRLLGQGQARWAPMPLLCAITPSLCAASPADAKPRAVAVWGCAKSGGWRRAPSLSFSAGGRCRAWGHQHRLSVQRWRQCYWQRR